MKVPEKLPEDTFCFLIYIKSLNQEKLYEVYKLQNFHHTRLKSSSRNKNTEAKALTKHV